MPPIPKNEKRGQRQGKQKIDITPKNNTPSSIPKNKTFKKQATLRSYHYSHLKIKYDTSKKKIFSSG